MSGASLDTIRRNLPVELTADELAAAGDRLSQVVLEVERLANEKSVTAKGFADRIKRLEAEQHKLAELVEAKAEERPVPCQVLRDYDRGKVAYRRIDTSEVVFVRDMSPAEQQIQIGESIARLDDDVAEAIRQFESQMSDDQRKEAAAQEKNLAADLAEAQAEGDKPEQVIRDFFADQEPAEPEQEDVA